MSSLELAIQNSLTMLLENVLGAEPGSNADPHTYPGGVDSFISAVVEMRMNEIRQWLHDPEDIRQHLSYVLGTRFSHKTLTDKSLI